MTLHALRRLDVMFDELYVLAETEPCPLVRARLLEIDSFLAAALENAEQLAELAPPKPARKVPSDTERYARACLRNAMGRVAATTDPAVLFLETKQLVRFVSSNHIDGVLVRKALLDVAVAAGLTLEQAEQTIASAVASARSAA